MRRVYSSGDKPLVAMPGLRKESYVRCEQCSQIEGEPVFYHRSQLRRVQSFWEGDGGDSPPLRQKSASLKVALILRRLADGQATWLKYARLEDEELPPLRDVLGISLVSRFKPGSSSMVSRLNINLGKQPIRWPKLRRVALLYGSVGMLSRRLNQDREAMPQILLHAFRQELPEVADAIARRAAIRVAQHGPFALRAAGWSSKEEPVLRRLEGLLAQGVPITRNAFPPRYLETQDTSDQIKLLAWMSFRWFSCPRGHWYAADAAGQKACAMHQRAERQARWRRLLAEASKTFGRYAMIEGDAHNDL